MLSGMMQSCLLLLRCSPMHISDILLKFSVLTLDAPFLNSFVRASTFIPISSQAEFWKIVFWFDALEMSECRLQHGLLWSRWLCSVYITQRITRAWGNWHLKPTNTDCCLHNTAWSINIFVWTHLELNSWKHQHQEVTRVHFPPGWSTLADLSGSQGAVESWDG